MIIFLGVLATAIVLCVIMSERLTIDLGEMTNANSKENH